MNNSCFTGRFTKNPELQEVGDKKKVNFNLAVARNFKNAEGVVEADYLQFEAWGTTAENICKFFKQGRMIGITATARSESWEDKETKEMKYNTKFLVDSWDFTDKKPEDKEEE